MKGCIGCNDITDCDEREDTVQRQTKTNKGEEHRRQTKASIRVTFSSFKELLQQEAWQGKWVAETMSSKRHFTVQSIVHCTPSSHPDVDHVVFLREECSYERRFKPSKRSNKFWFWRQDLSALKSCWSLEETKSRLWVFGNFREGQSKFMSDGQEVYSKDSGCRVSLADSETSIVKNKRWGDTLSWGKCHTCLGVSDERHGDDITLEWLLSRRSKRRSETFSERHFLR